MRRIVLGASLVLALSIPAAASAAHHRCHKLFTVRMGQRAARAVYAGTREASKRDLRVLGYIERCQRNPRAQSYVRWFDRHQGELNSSRRYDAAHPYSYGVASWYDDGGPTASGFHSTYGFADCGSGSFCVAFGTRVEFCYGGQCVTGVADDHGPYVGGRDFDLNQNIKDALGFDGVGTVAYRVL